MSLLSKFTNLFKSKDDVQHSLQKLLNPSTTNELQLSIKSFNQQLNNQTSAVFAILRQREALVTMDPKPEQLLNLLLVIHSNISNEEICDQLRQVPIIWLDRLMTENRESFIQIERMITEQSTNSYIPQQLQQSQSQYQQHQKKEEKIEDKRKARIEMNQKLQNPILNTEAVNNADSHNLNPKIYQSINRFIKAVEIQNIQKMNKISFGFIRHRMQMGLKLLQCPQKLYRPYQLLIYQDLFYFQSFLKQELEVHIFKENNLHIYEAFCEYQRAKQIMESFEPKYKFKLNINSSVIDDYQRNAIKQKVKSQFEEDQKRKKQLIKENQENIDQLNFQDLDSNHDFEREIIMRKFFDKGQSNQMSLDEISLQLKIINS
ncbi:unnamed protein product (macronuclear) [Paramecium tetraurelia]|uniref:EF-hand domain-containing protein n=1 Tax=Paramecium tetraurelia TaxID=5888 RepID=A0DJ08_PARTE|nr:uncharacterized protein GSPATT00017382001 [Paramecium tetraurelia]CAK83025.1 unnamed protein product [Paramecium tetraurelia]|eukprot:XP_001450422.1 hypothetical protein (macronuclear) [Paramecium tetraurelia strain d4-2]